TGRRYCGRTDVPLTSAGRRDATALGSRLASIAGGALVRTSPLRRAVETAALIARGGPFWVDERLREIDFGAAEGLSFAELARRGPRGERARGHPRRRGAHRARRRVERPLGQRRCRERDDRARPSAPARSRSSDRRRRTRGGGRAPPGALAEPARRSVRDRDIGRGLPVR